MRGWQQGPATGSRPTLPPREVLHRRAHCQRLAPRSRWEPQEGRPAAAAHRPDRTEPFTPATSNTPGWSEQPTCSGPGSGAHPARPVRHGGAYCGSSSTCPDRARAERAFDQVGHLLLDHGIVALDPEAEGEVHTPLNFRAVSRLPGPLSVRPADYRGPLGPPSQPPSRTMAAGCSIGWPGRPPRRWNGAASSPSRR